MAHTPENESVLRAAIDGASRVAASIAQLPDNQQQRALEAAEQSYRCTVRELEYSDDAANSWVAAIMYSLRAEVEKIAQRRRSAQIATEAGIKIVNGA
jgi:hypothetical protein